MPQLRRYFFTNIDNKSIYMYKGSIQDTYWKKGTYECLYVSGVHLHIKRIKNMHYFTNILKSETSSGDMNENIYQWLYYS